MNITLNSLFKFEREKIQKNKYIVALNKWRNVVIESNKLK